MIRLGTTPYVEPPTVRVPRRCTACRGAGLVAGPCDYMTEPCRECNGAGEVTPWPDLRARLTAYADDLQRQSEELRVGVERAHTMQRVAAALRALLAECAP